MKRVMLGTILVGVFSLAGCVYDVTNGKNADTDFGYKCVDFSKSSEKNRLDKVSFVANLKSSADLLGFYADDASKWMKLSTTSGEIKAIYSCLSEQKLEAQSLAKTYYDGMIVLTKKPEEKEALLNAYSLWVSYVEAISPVDPAKVEKTAFSQAINKYNLM